MRGTRWIPFSQTDSITLASIELGVCLAGDHITVRLRDDLDELLGGRGSLQIVARELFIACISGCQRLVIDQVRDGLRERLDGALGTDH